MRPLIRSKKSRAAHQSKKVAHAWYRWSLMKVRIREMLWLFYWNLVMCIDAFLTMFSFKLLMVIFFPSHRLSITIIIRVLFVERKCSSCLDFEFMYLHIQEIGHIHARIVTTKLIGSIRSTDILPLCTSTTLTQVRICNCDEDDTGSSGNRWQELWEHASSCRK